MTSRTSSENELEIRRLEDQFGTPEKPRGELDLSQFQSFTCERPTSASVMLLSNALGSIENKIQQYAFDRIRAAAVESRRVENVYHRYLLREVFENLRNFTQKQALLKRLRTTFEEKINLTLKKKYFSVMKESQSSSSIVELDESLKRTHKFFKGAKTLSFKLQSLEDLKLESEKSDKQSLKTRSISYFQGRDLQSKFYHKRPKIIPKF